MDQPPLPEHTARIFWSDQQIAKGLPDIAHTTDLSGFPDDPAGPEAWSLMCRFEVSPRAQGSPSLAKVRFLVEAAPHERLIPGAKLKLFERGTHAHAKVEILD